MGDQWVVLSVGARGDGAGAGVLYKAIGACEQASGGGATIAGVGLTGLMSWVHEAEERLQCLSVKGGWLRVAEQYSEDDAGG